MYHVLMNKRKVFYRKQLFNRMATTLNDLTLGEQRLWMIRFVYALKHHCGSDDIITNVSTRSVHQFLYSLDYLLCYHEVDDMCLYMCDRHVSRRCGCRRGERDCLHPHERSV